MQIDFSMLEIIFKGLEILSILGGGAVVLYRLGRTMERFTQMSEQRSLEISELKNDVKDINKVVTQLAVQSTQIDNLQRQQNLLDQRLEDLRHGRGLVLESFPKQIVGS